MSSSGLVSEESPLPVDRMAVMVPENPPSPLCLLKSLHSVLCVPISTQIRQR